MSIRSALASISLKKRWPPSGATARRFVPDLFLTSDGLGFPRVGLFHSSIVHAAIVNVLLYPPLYYSLSPPYLVQKNWESVRLSTTDSLVMTHVSNAAHALAAHSAREHRGKKRAVKQTYSGPHEIVSMLPNATNSVQTILRPDLLSPPTLKFPQLLKPVVILASKVPAIADAKPVNPVVNPQSTLHLKNTDVEKPKMKVASTAALPALETKTLEIKSALPASTRPSVIVLNAVTVPEDAPLMVPKAELSGSFAVHAVTSSPSSAGADAVEGSAASGPTASSAVDPHSEISISRADNPNATGITPAGNSGSNLKANRSQGSGLIIFGGTSRGDGRARVSHTTSATNGLTVISSGTSGGATHDMGVFDRSETVYSVYIPMADAGGGPDWAMQYAILGSLPSGGGLLTPPIAVKKTQAIVTSDSPGLPSTYVFFSAVISASGELTVKPLRQMDTRARQALDALWSWEFQPARLNGDAVAVKALIGVATISR